MKDGEMEARRRGHGEWQWHYEEDKIGFMEHRVSKLDTLAGIAIKYGVEVGDIKKMNGLALTTDLQLYALNSIKIPLPGRHLPSPNNSFNANSDSKGPSPHRLDSMSSTLQGYCGLNLKPARDTADDVKHSFVSPLGLRRKSRSVANGFLNKNAMDNGSGGGAFSAIIGNGLALRSNSKAAAGRERETKGAVLFPTPHDNSLALIPIPAAGAVRKCSSTPSLQDQYKNNLSTRWGTDVPIPIFDGLPNPTLTPAWKRKAALD